MEGPINEVLLYNKWTDMTYTKSVDFMQRKHK
jgi:hypothetical protein